MNTFKRVIVLAVLLGVLLPTAGADAYWSWGWGDYGNGPVENVARFDWSFLNYGNIPEGQATVDRCNAILALNPDHKFAIRFWPIMSLGKLPQNRYQMTLWDYFYGAGIKEKMREKIRSQYELLHKGLTRPESLVGMTFLEELPGHFTSAPFKRDLAPGFMPWDMEPFQKEIASELGHPFDFSRRDDLLWWGKKYSQFMNETHQYMRSLQPSAKILYWQATYYSTMDRPDKELGKAGVLPITMDQLLKEGHCDGIFGYPNSETVWEKQTMALVRQYNCLFFSQISTPAFMRLADFESMVQWARVQHPGNLGSFVYFGRDTSLYAWNMIPEFKGNSRVTMGEQQRWFCRKYEINNKIAAKVLQPEMLVGYDFRDKEVSDFVTLSVVIYNPRDASWFGGDAAAAALEDVAIELAGIPEDYLLPPESNSPPRLRLGRLGGGEVMEVLWWLQKKSAGTTRPEQLKIVVKAHQQPAVTWQGRSAVQLQQRTRLEQHDITTSGENWLTLTGGARTDRLQVELEAVLRDISYPRLQFNGQEILYKGVLGKGSKLLLYPGVRAELVLSPVFSDEVRRFRQAEGAEAAVFADGYLVYSTPSSPVEADAVYQLSLNGRVADGAILNVLVEFTGKRSGKPEKVTVGRYNPLPGKAESARLEVPVPTFDPGSEIKAVVRFYRHNKTGSLILREFDFTSGQSLSQDVSDKLDGQLLVPGQAIVLGNYSDRDEVNFAHRELARIRFVHPRTEADGSQESRRGGGDF